MNHLIERYVYDVTRRLPEKDREEVKKELISNITDMLPEGADEAETKEVLRRLGSPAALAEKYRQNPRYLISPAIYDEYVRVLKLVLPLVGGIVLAVGVIVGVVNALKDGEVQWPLLIGNMLATGIAMGVSGTFQALVWITVGFVIAERTGAKTGRFGEQEWKVEDLPEIPPNDKGKIPLSDSITELALTVVFSVVAILICVGVVPFVLIIQNGATQIHTIFSASFLASCVPAIAFMAVLDVIACAIKIKARRWTPLVCGAVVADKIAGISVFVYLINRSNIFSAEFTAFLRGVDWGSPDLIRFMGTSGGNIFIIIISLAVIVGSLAECGKAIYKTINYNRPR